MIFRSIIQKVLPDRTTEASHTGNYASNRSVIVTEIEAKSRKSTDRLGVVLRCLVRSTGAVVGKACDAEVIGPAKERNGRSDRHRVDSDWSKNLQSGEGLASS